MSLGLDAQARSDANTLAAAEPEQADFLLRYLDVLFPTFDFWPAKETPQSTSEGLPEKPARTLAEMKSVAQKYALRLQKIRKLLVK